MEEGVSASLCLLVAAYCLMALFTIIQLFLLIYYRHSFISFHVMFLLASIIWSGLRITFWLSTSDPNNCLWFIIYALPLFVQFVPYVLVLYFLINVIYGPSWHVHPNLIDNDMINNIDKNNDNDIINNRSPTFPTIYLNMSTSTYNSSFPDGYFHCLSTGLVCFPKRVYSTILILSVLAVFAFVVGFSLNRCSNSINSQKYDSGFSWATSIIFFSLAVALVMVAFRLQKLLSEPAVESSFVMRQKILVLITFLFAIFVSRAGFNALEPFINSGSIDVSSGHKNPTVLQVSVEIIWEVLPTAFILFFFRNIPRTKPRNNYLWPFKVPLLSEEKTPPYQLPDPVNRDAPLKSKSASSGFYRSVFDDPHRYDSEQESLDVTKNYLLKKNESSNSIDPGYASMATPGYAYSMATYSTSLRPQLFGTHLSPP